MNEINLSEKISKTIKEKGVKIRSRFSVLAERLGLESAAVFLVLVSILVIGLIGYALIQSGALEFTDFGFRGIGVILVNFPYELLIIAVLLIVIIAFILKRFDFSYKKNYSLIIAVIVGGVVLFGLTTAALNIPGKIHDFVQNKNIPLVSPFFRERMGYNLKHEGAQIGEIIKIKKDSLIIKTPDNLEIEVLYDENTFTPQDIEFEVGQKIAVLGTPQNGEIKALDIKIFSGRYWQPSLNHLPRPRRLGPFPLLK